MSYRTSFKNVAVTVASEQERWKKGLFFHCVRFAYFEFVPLVHPLLLRRLLETGDEVEVQETGLMLPG